MDSIHLPNIFVVDRITVKPLSVDFQLYPHLRDLLVANANKQTELLIGQDNSDALLPLEVLKGPKGQPFAVRTLFWCSVNGPARLGSPPSQKVVSYFVTANKSDGGTIHI